MTRLVRSWLSRVLRGCARPRRRARARRGVCARLRAHTAAAQLHRWRGVSYWRPGDSDWIDSAREHRACAPATSSPPDPARTWSCRWARARGCAPAKPRSSGSPVSSRTSCGSSSRAARRRSTCARSTAVRRSRSTHRTPPSRSSARASIASRSRTTGRASPPGAAGSAAIATQGGLPTEIEADEQLVVTGSDAPVLVSQGAPALDDWDRWNYSRSEEQSNPDSARYVPDGVYGVDDLDEYGAWRRVPTYGAVWVPRVAAGWVPYSTGLLGARPVLRLDLGRRRAVGLGAVPLRPLGPRERILGVVAWPSRRAPVLRARAGRVLRKQELLGRRQLRRRSVRRLGRAGLGRAAGSLVGTARLPRRRSLGGLGRAALREQPRDQPLHDREREQDPPLRARRPRRCVRRRRSPALRAAQRSRCPDLALRPIAATTRRRSRAGRPTGPRRARQCRSQARRSGARGA